MANITIRNLDASTKQLLRERAARNGRSMEEEARLLLGAGVDAGESQNGPQMHDDNSSIEDYPAAGGSLLLIISGGIAAYKALDLIRRLRERRVNVRCIMTPAARQFVTELAAGAIAGGRVFGELWDREAEHDIGHIRLAREADLIVVAPATADLMAKMANGAADDLASAVLLARDTPVLVAPAMNPAMWQNPATRRNISTLRSDGVHFIGPESGEMAESGEAGTGRMAEPMAIVARIGALLDRRPKPLAGLKAIVTSGPTHEPIDPVRYIANRSSGKQGHAIAAALAAAGAHVTLVSGPVTIADPPGVQMVRVETARQMAEAVIAALPADLAVMVAAVADWRSVHTAEDKMKKKDGKGPQSLELTENPDILKAVGHHRQRPRLVIGFAAETRDLEKNARAKLDSKRADWILANDVSAETGVMGGDRNTIRLISHSGSESWPELSKPEVAKRLVENITDWFRSNTRQA
jgi:phosphopantothenoylcysteine decarboxylase / phosphopantothenate---cysteine ligase